MQQLNSKIAGIKLSKINILSHLEFSVESAEFEKSLKEILFLTEIFADESHALECTI